MIEPSKIAKIGKKAGELVPEKLKRGEKIWELTFQNICLVRSYDVSKVLSNNKWQDILAAAVEGAGTGAVGFMGIPFNIVFSTFLYFRAVQSIAMFYGYDVKNDSAELVIARDVFSHALSSANNDVNNEMTSIIGKIMVMSQAATVKQMSKKTWADMASRGGIPLLLTQMRALANKAAQKALEKAGQQRRRYYQRKMGL